MSRPTDASRWRKPPLFRSDAATHRQATWLELFFDLVFVVTIAGLVSVLRDDLSIAGLTLFLVVFAPTWWLWMDFSYYGDQFDTDDVVYRLALLGVMFGVLVAGQGNSEAISSGGLGPLIFAGMYAILAGLYRRARTPNPALAPLVDRYVLAMVIASVLFAASAFASAPWRYALWFAAIAVPMANAPLTYLKYPDLPSQVSHMPERFGLFAIIALGESLVAVNAALGHATGTIALGAGAAAGFAIGASLWWIYFIRDDPSALSAALEGGREALLRSHVYGYSHLLVYAGVVVAAVGIEEALLDLGGEARGGSATDAGDGHGGGGGDGHAAFAHALVPGGVGVALVGTALVHRAAARSLPGPVFALRLVVAAALVAASIAIGAGTLSSMPSLALHATAAATVLLAGVETWRLPHPDALPDEAAAGAGDQSGG